jgi:hypothetical protein
MALNADSASASRQSLEHRSHLQGINYRLVSHVDKHDNTRGGWQPLQPDAWLSQRQRAHAVRTSFYTQHTWRAACPWLQRFTRAFDISTHIVK